MKYSSVTLQNLLYFMCNNTHVVFLLFHFKQLFPLMTALVYVDIDQGIQYSLGKLKCKVVINEKWYKKQQGISDWSPQTDNQFSSAPFLHNMYTVTELGKCCLLWKVVLVDIEVKDKSTGSPLKWWSHVWQSASLQVQGDWGWILPIDVIFKYILVVRDFQLC